MSTKPNDLLRALRAGADGFLAKDFSSERLGEALRAAARGETPIARAMTPVLVREFQRQNQVRRTRSRVVRERLTPREWQILSLLADGKSTVGIATDLVVSIETVRSHVKAVMRKLQVHSRVAAIACLEDLRETTELAARELESRAFVRLPARGLTPIRPFSGSDPRTFPRARRTDRPTWRFARAGSTLTARSA